MEVLRCRKWVMWFHNMRTGGEKRELAFFFVIFCICCVSFSYEYSTTKYTVAGSA